MKKNLTDWIGSRVYVPGKGIGMVVKVMKGRLVVELDDDGGMTFAFASDCREAELVAA